MRLNPTFTGYGALTFDAAEVWGISPYSLNPTFTGYGALTKTAMQPKKNTSRLNPTFTGYGALT